MCGLVNPSALDALEHLEHINRPELGDGTRADIRKHQSFKGPYRLGEGGRRQLPFLQRQPFARDRFKGICVGELLGLALTAWINASGELPARGVATFAGLFQRGVGMGSQRQPVLSAVVAVFEAPQFAAPRGYLEV